jgi:hypothetical protein
MDFYANLWVITFCEHKAALLMQCVESVIDVLLPVISLISSGITTALYSKHE